MNRRLLLTGGIAAPAILGCGVMKKLWTLRYRLRVIVAVGGREYEGASVFKTNYFRGSMQDQARGFEYVSESWGEGIPIGLGGRGLIVGALGSVFGVGTSDFFTPIGASSIVVPMQQSGLIPRSDTTKESLFELARQVTGEHEWPTHRPTLLLFDRTRKRESARVLFEGRIPPDSSPDVPFQSFHDAFDPGAGLRSVSIEIVNSEPTEQIVEALPWVVGMDASNGGWGGLVGRPFPNNLRSTNFMLLGVRG
jgi:hypothetical protein